jgi:hypothetical protein
MTKKNVVVMLDEKKPVVNSLNLALKDDKGNPYVFLSDDEALIFAIGYQEQYPNKYCLINLSFSKYLGKIYFVTELELPEEINPVVIPPEILTSIVEYKKNLNAEIDRQLAKNKEA